MVSNIYCEVICNRADSILTMTSKSSIKGKHSIKVPSQRLVSDQLEIGRLTEWIRTLRVTNIAPVQAFKYEAIS